jgi:hypothetical protein
MAPVSIFTLHANNAQMTFGLTAKVISFMLATTKSALRPTNETGLGTFAQSLTTLSGTIF